MTQTNNFPPEDILKEVKSNGNHWSYSYVFEVITLLIFLVILFLLTQKTVNDVRRSNDVVLREMATQDVQLRKDIAGDREEQLLRLFHTCFTDNPNAAEVWNSIPVATPSSSPSK